MEHFIIYIAVGFFLFTIIYNSFLYKFTKDITSKYIVLVFINFLIFLLCSHFQIFFSRITKFNYEIICLIENLSVFLISKYYILYTKNYLKERGELFKNTFLEFYLKKHLVLLLFIPLVLIFIFNEHFYFNNEFIISLFYHLIGVSAFVFTLIHFLQKKLQKKKSFRLLFLANIIISVGTITSYLFSFFININSDILSESDIYVSIFFSIFLSISTSEKINILTQEKEKAQEKALMVLEEKVKERTVEITRQKHLIEDKQKEILDSITYAKRLQQAILPPTEFITKNIPASFILYKPKDIVAGDFYWAEQIGNFFFIASADCTGHGVPGAMVSVVCSNALNRTVKEFSLTDTGKILDKTRELVIETFAKSNAEVKDGMDISLLCLDQQNQKVFWSGANNPLWYINNNELKEIKADKQHIGKTEYPKPFTTHQIEFEINTTFYLFTDGFADQFGGPKGKKFKYKQFSDLLISHINLNQQQQAETINSVFEDWKGNLEQVDDVCLIGIKI